jgi:molybdate transport system substrate-binding protein
MRKSRIGRRLFAAVTLLLLGFALAPRAAQAEDVLVFAAASLKNALDDAAKAYEADTGNKIVISYAGTPQLVKQLEQGAPADIFFSADMAWMATAAEKGLVKKDSQTILLGNRIVLVAPADSTASLRIEKGFDLSGALKGGKLAMANTDSVPAGKYGKAALENLGVWDSVAQNVAQAENVRAALAFVALGEAPFGIVYATDASAESKVKVVDIFPEDSHPAIKYPLALTTSSTKAAARDFFAFLISPKARNFFAKYGFTVLTPVT